eukprot:TRINITY_DN489_c0_g1_i11.p2 TRINITY_DN489_c0_g1~~TRINITY_DN489_c0_g1_i11.p2  ORF type:complete len:107 (+),score=38.06 TRINITY_DN489_c0_g1_i11:113-433(+)
MIRRPPRSTQSRSSAASDVYKRQLQMHHGRDDDLDHIAVLPGDVMALEHFAQRMGDGRDLVVMLTRGLQMNERSGRIAELVRIHRGPVAGNDSGILHSAHPFGNRG